MKLPACFRENTRAKVLLALYSLLMIWLLFGRGVHWQGDYWTQVQGNLNLIPFRTIRLYIRLLQETENILLIRHAVINLVGNIVMFVPLGLLLPRVWPCFRSAWKFVLAVTLLICLVEVIQLFTLVGSCDVDDLMLNVVGAEIGFLIVQLRERNRENI